MRWKVTCADSIRRLRCLPSPERKSTPPLLSPLPMNSKNFTAIARGIGELCAPRTVDLGNFPRRARARDLRFANAIRCCQRDYTCSHSLARWLRNTPKPCKRPAPRISAPSISSAVNGGSSGCCSSSRPSSAARGRERTRPRSSCPSPAPTCAISPRRIAILCGDSAPQSLVWKSPGRARPGFSLPTAGLHSVARRRVKPSRKRTPAGSGATVGAVCALPRLQDNLYPQGCRHGFPLPSVARVSPHPVNCLGRSIFARLHSTTFRRVRPSLVPHPSYP